MSVFGAAVDGPDRHPRWCSRNHCRASGCTKHVKPVELMCPAHWRLVPQDLRLRLATTYRGTGLTPAWQIAAERAINAVALKEHRPARHWFRGVDLLHPSGVCAPAVDIPSSTRPAISLQSGSPDDQPSAAGTSLAGEEVLTHEEARSQAAPPPLRRRS